MVTDMSKIKIDRRKLYTQILEVFRVVIKLVAIFVTLVLLCYAIVNDVETIIMYITFIPVLECFIDVSMKRYIEQYATVRLDYKESRDLWVFSYIRGGDYVSYSIRLEDIKKCDRSIDGCTLYGVFNKTWYRRVTQVDKVYIPDLVKEFDVFYSDVKDIMEDK